MLKCAEVCKELQHCVLWNTHVYSPLFVYLELSYWWGRRRWRGNGRKCWGWDVLWGATVRTGNGRPGAGDQEHIGAVALDALSDLIIGAFIHNHISLSLCLCVSLSYRLVASLCSVSAVSFVCMLSFIHSEFLYLETQSSNPGML